MILPDIPSILPTLPTPPPVYPTAGGLQFRDAAPTLCQVVDNGIDVDDPRVLQRTNEATKIVLDFLIPVGGMAIANVTPVQTIVVLPPQMENAIEAVPTDEGTMVFGQRDIAQGWYEIVNNSAYLDPAQHHDNPLQDLGLWAAPWPGYEGQLVRVYVYPGLQPDNAVVTVTGAKRYVPMTKDDDYMIVQNLEALKLIICSIERYENNDIEGAQKFRQTAMEMLQAEVKKHLMDPRNYMRRKAQYQREAAEFGEYTMGWMRAHLALDVEDALKTGRQDLAWAINQVERRILQGPKTFKDGIRQVTAEVVGGFVYFPANVQSVLAVSLDGKPIPIRSEFFPHLENGPGGSGPICSSALTDMGDEITPGGLSGVRRKYRLNADCTTEHELTAVCKLRWLLKQPQDMMVIKNYEVIRLLVESKFLEKKEQWQQVQMNQQLAYKILDDELRDYLAGIRHTVHVQTYGFGMGDMNHGTL